jgi:hypothetical protein
MLKQHGTQQEFFAICPADRDTLRQHCARSTAIVPFM